MPPEIMKTLLLDEWVIVTRSTKKDGFAVAHEGKKYTIPKEILEQIAYDYLIKEAIDCEKGYTFEITKKDYNEVFKVTVERVHGAPRQWHGPVIHNGASLSAGALINK